MSKLRTAVIATAYTGLVIAFLVLLPLTLALAAIIVLTVLFILADAWSHRILFKMSIRNVIRRPGTTALVLGGLMIGTAIISASLVVGDTFDNMIVGEIAQEYGAVDFRVGGPGDDQDGYYDLSAVDPVRDRVLELDHVATAEWYLSSSSSIKDLNTDLSLPAVAVYGITPAVVSGLGGFVAPDGSAIRTMPSAGHVYVNQHLAGPLSVQAGDTIVLYHDANSLTLTVGVVVGNEAIGAMAGDQAVFVDLASAQALRGQTDRVNVMAVALDPAGRADINVTRAALASVLFDASFQELELDIRSDRAVSIERGRENVSMFTSLFFVFGSFSIIAGVVLIVNIFTMLGEERKGEMGMARAVGMQRHHLRKLFIYEGMVYATVTAAIGTLFGLLLAYGLITALSMVIDLGDVAAAKYFGFTPLSLILAYLAGFMLTMVSIYLVTHRISNMNIVRAIRNIPEPLRSRDDRRTFRLGLLMAGGGAALMLLGIGTETLAMAMSGLSLITVSMGLVLRKFTGDRIAWSIAGFATLFVWMPKGFEIFPYPGFIEMFVISGVFMVTALLIIVMFNSDSVVAFFTRLLRVRGGYQAVVRTALSYPLRAKMRTALSIFIFGLVIFTVTTLSMMSGMLGVGIPKMIDETSGGFDIVAFSAAPLDMWSEINTTTDLVDPGNITEIVQLSRGYALFTFETAAAGTLEQEVRYDAIGVTPALHEKGNYPLTEWNRTLYPTEADVWRAVESDPTLVVLDGSAAAVGTSPADMMIGQGSFRGIALGDAMIMTDRQGDNHTLVVVGFMKQSAFSGAFMNEELVRAATGVDGTNLFMIKLVEGADTDRQSILIQNQFWTYGVLTIPMSSMAEDAVAQIDGIFNLIKAFLAMGLIIGISGLGIITIRSIHERRVEIGMMRAIGYTKRMVVANFALESAFVSVLGILIGSFLGILTGYQLWDSGFSSMGIDFLIPWEPILLVGAGAFLATLLTVLPAARGASRVAPAEVLRFE